MLPGILECPAESGYCVQGIQDNEVGVIHDKSAFGYAGRMDDPRSTASPEPLLRVRDLRIRFGGEEAVKGISFHIGAGETLGLVGESGSGKSATSLALMRLLPASAEVSGAVLLRGGGRVKNGVVPTSGNRGIRGWWSHRFADATGSRAPGSEMPSPAGAETALDLLELPEERMRRHRGRSLGMIFQEPMTALNPVMAIGRQVGEAILAHAPRTPRAVVRERVLEVLHAVALPDPQRRLRDYPHQFSGGQRQRIVIAMALINRPRLLIADEPTTALDVTVQAQILDLLKRLRADYGLAMLFISHDLPVVGQIADRIAVMRRGEIVEVGPARALLTAPQHPYTRALLAAAPTMRTPRDRPLPVPAGESKLAV